MNITDVLEEKVEGEYFPAIFKRQEELMSKYHDIELRSGLMQTEDCPVNLNDKKGQARIKDFAWRVMEELGEALDAYFQDDIVHTKEELADGLHFFTELSILAGYSFQDIPIGGDKLVTLWESAKYMPATLPEATTNFVTNLGMTCNCLKNKPWKQSQMLTDVENFYHKLFKAWMSYIKILSLVFETPEEAVSVYFKKSNVNKFRQRSGY